MYSIQHYVIKFVGDLRQVNKTDRHDITNIVESGITFVRRKHTSIELDNVN
jgi:hypothetical protein